MRDKAALPVRRAALNCHICGLAIPGSGRRSASPAVSATSTTSTMLSKEDHVILSNHPLANNISPLRDQVFAAAATLDPWEADEVEAPLVFTQLLVTLMAHDAAFHLKAKTTRGNLASELARLLAIVQSGLYDARPFQPLAQAVIDRSRDEDIWEAVYVLLEMSLRPGSALRSSTTPDSPTTIQTPLQSSRCITRKMAHLRAVSDKVSIADAVRDNDYFFPFKPSASPRELHPQREAFKQAVLRDLDRLYIRIVDQEQNHDAFRAIATSVRSLGQRFPLWEFEAATFKVVKDLHIELGDFEVFKGLHAWSNIAYGPA